MYYCCCFEWLTRWRLPERHENSLLQQMGTGFRVLVSGFVSLASFAAFHGIVFWKMITFTVSIELYLHLLLG